MKRGHAGTVRGTRGAARGELRREAAVPLEGIGVRRVAGEGGVRWVGAGTGGNLGGGSGRGGETLGLGPGETARTRVVAINWVHRVSGNRRGAASRNGTRNEGQGGGEEGGGIASQRASGQSRDRRVYPNRFRQRAGVAKTRKFVEASGKGVGLGGPGPEGVGGMGAAVEWELGGRRYGAIAARE